MTICWVSGEIQRFHLEGKKYIVKDGNIINFSFNV
ncbi:MAG: DUF933 domain-containing protein [Chloroflexota bacterium]|nr:DUF933 domain-containing protein [Chloroflexota bacterium]